MLVPGGWILALLVSWMQLTLQVSRASAKVWKDRMKVSDFGQSTQIFVVKEDLSDGQMSQQQQQHQLHHHQHQYHHHHTNHHFEDVLYTDRDDGGWHIGAISLIISVLTEKIVQEMTSPSTGEEERLHERQAQSLRHKLKGLYAYLKDHPALKERRLYVGSKKPQLPDQFQKRDFDPFTLDIAQPVCPSLAEWRQLHKARDINQTEVQVYQPETGNDGMQWFYTVTCANAGFAWQRDCQDCCIGINHARYASSCQPKRTFVMALVRKHAKHRYDWNWIQVDTSCNCAVKPLNPFDFG